MPQVLSPRFHILQRGQSVYPPVPVEDLPVSVRHFGFVLTVARITGRTGQASSATVACVFTITCAAPGLIYVVFAHPESVAADFAGHLDPIFARSVCRRSWPGSKSQIPWPSPCIRGQCPSNIPSCSDAEHSRRHAPPFQFGNELALCELLRQLRPRLARSDSPRPGGGPSIPIKSSLSLDWFLSRCLPRKRRPRIATTDRTPVGPTSYR
jgi:hypothetical protein